MSDKIISAFADVCDKLLQAFTIFVKLCKSAVDLKKEFKKQIENLRDFDKVKAQHSDIQFLVNSMDSVKEITAQKLKQLKKDLRDPTKWTFLNEALKSQLNEIYKRDENFIWINTDEISHRYNKDLERGFIDPKINKISPLTHLVLINEHTVVPTTFETLPLSDENLFEIHCTRNRIARFEFHQSQNIPYVIDGQSTNPDGKSGSQKNIDTIDGTSKIILNIENDYTECPWAISETYDCLFGTVTFDSFYYPHINRHLLAPQFFMSYGIGQRNFIEQFYLTHAKSLIKIIGTVGADILLGAPPFTTEMFECTKTAKTIGDDYTVENFLREFIEIYKKEFNDFKQKCKLEEETAIVSIVKLKFKSIAGNTSGVPASVTLINLPYNDASYGVRNSLIETFKILYLNVTTDKNISTTPLENAKWKMNPSQKQIINFVETKCPDMLSDLNSTEARFHLICYAENEVIGDQTIAVKSLREILKFATLLLTSNRYGGGKHTRKKYLHKLKSNPIAIAHRK